MVWRKEAPAMKQVFVFDGMRFPTTKPPVHLLAEGGRYPLVSPEELLLDADPYGFTSHEAAEVLDVVEPVKVDDQLSASSKYGPGVAELEDDELPFLPE